MVNVLLPVANGSEDIETVTLIDVLRRAELDVVVASCEREGHTVTLARGTRLITDVRLDELDDSLTFDAIVLPGGMPGALTLRDSEALAVRLRHQHDTQAWLAAICAAPGVVLASHDLVRGHDVTGFPAFQTALVDAGGHLSHQPVVEDQHLITSQGPATAMAFALHLVRRLVDEETAARIADGLLTTLAPYVDDIRAGHAR